MSALGNETLTIVISTLENLDSTGQNYPADFPCHFRAIFRFSGSGWKVVIFQPLRVNQWPIEYHQQTQQNFSSNLRPKTFEKITWSYFPTVFFEKNSIFFDQNFQKSQLLTLYKHDFNNFDYRFEFLIKFMTYIDVFEIRVRNPKPSKYWHKVTHLD